MPADFQIVQGDAAPYFEDILRFNNGELAEPESIEFVMRSPTSMEPLALKGASQILNREQGRVVYIPNVADTATPGGYMANWRAEIEGKQMTFPTVGYLWVEVQPNLTSRSAVTLVALPEMKDYLNIPANDRIHDDKLIRFIKSVRPIIENIVGPILPQVFEEYHDGGNYYISLRRRPSSSMGTNPVYTLMACSEYRGPIEYPLTIIPNPAQGTIYSCMFHPHQGIVERRTSGGGVMAFPKMASAVHVVYQAGQQQVPENVKEAALETVRVYYQTTQAVGPGRQTVADVEELGTPFGGMYLPRRARELLQPNRRSPSIF